MSRCSPQRGEPKISLSTVQKANAFFVHNDLTQQIKGEFLKGDSLHADEYIGARHKSILLIASESYI